MLFNKNNNGSEEIYQLTGTFHAATDFKSIETDVQLAESQVAGVAGSEVMEMATEAYASGTNQALLDAVRLPIACLAVSYYARKSGLSVGETGRKLKVDENEKVPFEWMLDRDNRELRERYYRAIDMMLEYISVNYPDIENSRRGPSIVKTIDDFESVYPINGSRYTLHLMRSLLAEAQESLEKKIASEDISKLASMPAAIRYVVLTALTTALKRWSLSIFPVEIARQFSPSYQGNRENRAASIDEMRWCIEQFTEQSNSALIGVMIELGLTSDGRKLPKNDKKNKFFTA